MAGTRFKDYYAIMGVPADATAEQIKAAYRKLARRFHPDVSKEPEAQSRFAEIGEAYEVLGDLEKRRTYDEVRVGGWRDGQEYTSPQAGPEAAGMPDAEQFSEFFNSLFGIHRGTRRARRDARRGEDIHHLIELSLEEAYGGGERELQLQLPGSSDPDLPEVRTLRVTIPKGLAEGEHIRLRGQGWPGTAPGLEGNLYLEVALKPHPLFRAEGRHILLDLPLAPWEAVLGAQVRVPTLGGPTTVTIPPGSREGQRLRLRGRGLPGDPPGDQQLTLRITVPPPAGERAQALWRELAAVSPYDPRAHLGG